MCVSSNTALIHSLFLKGNALNPPSPFHYPSQLTMEVIENITVGQTEGKTACLASKGTLVESFKIRPDAFGIVPVTLGVGSKRQRNVSCDEGKQDDRYGEDLSSRLEL